MQFNSEGGNIDERVPYIGYAGESEEYTAAGISAYNALQTHVEKKLSHGLQAGFSYTYSRSLDEQSALGLVYNGSNPLDLRRRLRPLGLRPHTRVQHRLPLRAAEILLGVIGRRENCRRLGRARDRSRFRADSLTA